MVTASLRRGGLRSDRRPKPNKRPNKAPPGGPEIAKMSNTPGWTRTSDPGIRNPPWMCGQGTESVRFSVK